MGNNNKKQKILPLSNSPKEYKKYENYLSPTTDDLNQSLSSITYFLDDLAIIENKTKLKKMRKKRRKVRKFSGDHKSYDINLLNIPETILTHR